MGPEWQLSEQPLIAQLEAMGWTYIKGSLDDPAPTGRESFAEVVQREVLRERLRAINTRTLSDGSRTEWLDDERISTAVSALIVRLCTMAWTSEASWRVCSWVCARAVRLPVALSIRTG